MPLASYRSFDLMLSLSRPFLGLYSKAFRLHHILGCLFIVFRYSLCGFQGANPADISANGDEEIRTLDPLLARQVLSQLSYIPTKYDPSWNQRGLEWTRTTDLPLIRRTL